MKRGRLASLIFSMLGLCLGVGEVKEIERLFVCLGDGFEVCSLIEVAVLALRTTAIAAVPPSRRFGLIEHVGVASNLCSFRSSFASCVDYSIPLDSEVSL